MLIGIGGEKFEVDPFGVVEPAGLVVREGFVREVLHSSLRGMRTICATSGDRRFPFCGRSLCRPSWGIGSFSGAGWSDIRRARGIGGEGDDDADEFVLGVRDEFGDADRGEDADARAAGRGFAGQGDDGDAHPEGVATGGDAVVGEGIEADVDVVVEAKIIEAILREDEFDAVGGDAERAGRFHGFAGGRNRRRTA